MNLYSSRIVTQVQLSCQYRPVGLVLLMSGEHREVGRIFALTAALNIVLNLAFIPFFGIVGVAVATACAIIFHNVVLRSHLAKVHQLDTSVFRLA